MNLKEREFFYETIAPSFDKLMNSWELHKRLKIVFEDLLPDSLASLKFLDAGCGTGHFSKIAAYRGAEVTALDVGPRLLAEVRKKAHVAVEVGDICSLEFPDEYFDVVLCTEVLEHVNDPLKAIAELCRVTKKNGLLIITTVNKLWAPLINLASIMHLRPYHGLENPPWPSVLVSAITKHGFVIEKQFGFNTILSFIRFLDLFDGYGESLLPLMLNIGIRAKKT